MSHDAAPAGGESGEPGRYPLARVLGDGTRILIRPIAPDDADREQSFVRSLSAESRYFRFMNTLSELSPQLLERFTHPDPASEIALVALAADAGGRNQEQVAVARCARAESGDRSEFAIVVADRLQGRGLGQLLMEELIESARARGWPRIEGIILWNNHHMLELMHALGFTVTPSPEDAHLRIATLELTSRHRVGRA